MIFCYQGHQAWKCADQSDNKQSNSHWLWLRRLHPGKLLHNIRWWVLEAVGSFHLKVDYNVGWGGLREFIAWYEPVNCMRPLAFSVVGCWPNIITLHFAILSLYLTSEAGSHLNKCQQWKWHFCLELNEGKYICILDIHVENTDERENISVLRHPCLLAARMVAVRSLSLGAIHRLESGRPALHAHMRGRSLPRRCRDHLGQTILHQVSGPHVRVSISIEMFQTCVWQLQWLDQKMSQLEAAEQNHFGPDPEASLDHLLRENEDFRRSSHEDWGSSNVTRCSQIKTLVQLFITSLQCHKHKHRIGF